MEQQSSVNIFEAVVTQSAFLVAKIRFLPQRCLFWWIVSPVEKHFIYRLLLGKPFPIWHESKGVPYSKCSTGPRFSNWHVIGSVAAGFSSDIGFKHGPDVYPGFIFMLHVLKLSLHCSTPVRGAAGSLSFISRRLLRWRGPRVATGPLF